MSKLIGVMPLWDDEKQSIWMLPDYIDGLKAAGLDAVIFPMTEDEAEIRKLASLCDGFLLTGGQDVNPAMYGEAVLNDTVAYNNTRDRMDSFVLRLAIESDKAVLGICRGIQLMNAALGGTLYQDLPAQHGSEIDHHMASPYNRICHEVRILEGTPLYQLIGKGSIPVNSIHHQAIKDLAPGLGEMARSTDGLIEAVYKPDNRFVWGIQWHPEYWYKENPDCMKIFTAFAKACE
ncbi:MAG: gamma-glutamyl-gamma-aminobutyrate hydrolase family protein [Lachnospiraceae bacterium]|jgi:putative glutamine amidotransferase|nr:gamma-glutamyl-gamma-aminobutyrate hydrolase family protein [Lachnospiraceae bacterium]MCH4030878.1 gamma-glutamyl-gamma-aminobutyrate hydrolase family protein [Lachnospiraceae bacterium]MCH4070852.1 gamma-glutamyl-gamma-aminobutyrate hydrolase family protein [Lachnospiraceae bacterium]MCH4106974.1 gamma-glutamyl-gamma-aminobutyrate hydrolase family protein [Lachnospiraceae bacterium]MCI1302172.1 gamma-glutamyl-gamma-aminobutyrate hydrolase family protein [Lachnospiraceae bacterium]